MTTPVLTALMRATIEANAATIEALPGATIRPPTADPGSSGKRALALVSRTSDLDLEGTLGEGGMGVVRLGTQVSLGRKVAIKTLKGDHADQAAVVKLLREAWVTGALEHPNVLPIHDVRMDDKGMPLVVLKRIEGTDWSQIMRDEPAMQSRFGAGDLLTHNLHVLGQVCRAVAFAHSRGIVHRDLKPDNVRIGAFGEVYLLDWGLAVSLHDDGSGRFPLASDARDMAGTPSYMAPEMLGEDDPPSIGPRSDVYLLGAILYEVMMGRPPHTGPSALAIITSVLKSDPRFDDAAPAELAQIARRAMQKKPADRFDGADELRLAVSRYLEHRSSLSLAKQAMARLDELEGVLGESSDDSNRRVRAYDLFGECRFGFAEALASWPDNVLAKQGQERAVRSMIDLELERGDARAAKSLLEQLAAPADELAERIESGLAAQRAEERRRADLEQLGRELDKTVGARTRWFISIAFGVVWTVWPLYRHATRADVGSASYTRLLSFGVGMIVLSVVAFVWARESLTKTAINRRISAALGTMFGAHLVLGLGGMLMGIEPLRLEVMLFLVWCIVATLLSIAIERRLFPTAIVQLLAFFSAAALPDARFLIMSASNLFTMLNLAAIWRPDVLFPAIAARRAARNKGG